MADAHGMSASFAAFLVASLVLALTPGPGVIYIVARTLDLGRRAGVASVAGIALGNLANAVAASVGLAAILAVSAAAFAIVKLAGACYLIYLGLKALRARPTSSPMRRSSARLFRDGFLVALLNPKTALFFAALLPQFLGPDADPMRQGVELGGVFVTVAACTDMMYVLASAQLAAVVRRRAGSWPHGRYLTAASLIGLGLYAALLGPRPTE